MARLACGEPLLAIEKYSVQYLSHLEFSLSYLLNSSSSGRSSTKAQQATNSELLKRIKILPKRAHVHDGVQQDDGRSNSPEIDPSFAAMSAALDQQLHTRELALLVLEASLLNSIWGRIDDHHIALIPDDAFAPGPDVTTNPHWSATDIPRQLSRDCLRLIAYVNDLHEAAMQAKETFSWFKKAEMKLLQYIPMERQAAIEHLVSVVLCSPYDRLLSSPIDEPVYVRNVIDVAGDTAVTTQLVASKLNMLLEWSKTDTESGGAVKVLSPEDIASPETLAAVASLISIEESPTTVDDQAMGRALAQLMPAQSQLLSLLRDIRANSYSFILLPVLSSRMFLLTATAHGITTYTTTEDPLPVEIEEVLFNFQSMLHHCNGQTIQAFPISAVVVEEPYPSENPVIIMSTIDQLCGTACLPKWSIETSDTHRLVFALQLAAQTTALLAPVPLPRITYPATARILRSEGSVQGSYTERDPALLQSATPVSLYQPHDEMYPSATSTYGYHPARHNELLSATTPRPPARLEDAHHLHSPMPPADVEQQLHHFEPHQRQGPPPLQQEAAPLARSLQQMPSSAYINTSTTPCSSAKLMVSLSGQQLQPGVPTPPHTKVQAPVAAQRFHFSPSPVHHYHGEQQDDDSRCHFSRPYLTPYREGGPEQNSVSHSSMSHMYVGHATSITQAPDGRTQEHQQLHASVAGMSHGPNIPLSHPSSTHGAVLLRNSYKRTALEAESLGEWGSLMDPAVPVSHQGSVSKVSSNHHKKPYLSGSMACTGINGATALVDVGKHSKSTAAATIPVQGMYGRPLLKEPVNDLPPVSNTSKLHDHQERQPALVKLFQLCVTRVPSSAPCSHGDPGLCGDTAAFCHVLSVGDRFPVSAEALSSISGTKRAEMDTPSLKKLAHATLSLMHETLLAPHGIKLNVHSIGRNGKSAQSSFIMRLYCACGSAKMGENLSKLLSPSATLHGEKASEGFSQQPTPAVPSLSRSKREHHPYSTEDGGSSSSSTNSVSAATARSLRRREQQATILKLSGLKNTGCCYTVRMRWVDEQPRSSDDGSGEGFCGFEVVCVKGHTENAFSRWLASIEGEHGGVRKHAHRGIWHMDSLPNATSAVLKLAAKGGGGTRVPFHGEGLSSPVAHNHPLLYRARATPPRKKGVKRYARPGRPRTRPQQRSVSAHTSRQNNMTH